MITKHELKTYRDDLIALKQVERRIDELETRLYHLRSPTLTGMPHAQTTVSGSPQERAADQYGEKLDELRAFYVQEGAKLAERCKAVEDALERLPQRYRTLMRAHYVEGLRWSQVCELYPYSWERVMQLHRKALDWLKSHEL